MADLRHTTDDAIHRYEGRWIDWKGTEAPFAIRYSTYGVFGAAFLLFAGIAFALQLGAANAVTIGIAASLLITALIMRISDGDAGVIGSLHLVALSVRTWIRQHSIRAPRPIRVRLTDVFTGRDN
jgi:hypothetical protein